MRRAQPTAMQIIIKKRHDHHRACVNLEPSFVYGYILLYSPGGVRHTQRNPIYKAVCYIT